MRVLVLSVHPDDEALGCAGAILRHRAEGDEIAWTIVTEGHEPAWSADLLGRKSAEVERAATAYGVDRPTKLGFPAARLDTVAQADLMTAIREAVTDARPEIVYLVHGGDVHSDHRAACTAAMAVLKPFHLRRLGIRKVLHYETLSSTEAAPLPLERPFAPNVFVDITPYLERKIEVMALFETERQEDPLPRGPSAIRALARTRGAAIGVEYAEAFMLAREVR